eukprot:symbB.v1.2.035370.t1/scaffold4745.1/size37077/2
MTALAAVAAGDDAGTRLAKACAAGAAALAKWFHDYNVYDNDRPKEAMSSSNGPSLATGVGYGSSTIGWPADEPVGPWLQGKYLYSPPVKSCSIRCIGTSQSRPINCTRSASVKFEIGGTGQPERLFDHWDRDGQERGTGDGKRWCGYTFFEMKDTKKDTNKMDREKMDHRDEAHEEPGRSSGSQVVNVYMDGGASRVEVHRPFNCEDRLDRESVYLKGHGKGNDHPHVQEMIRRGYVQGPVDLEWCSAATLQGGGNSSSSSVDEVMLQRWNGSVWLDLQEELPSLGWLTPSFSGLTAGTFYNPISWLRLPLLDRMQWRVLASDRLLNHWALKEVHFFEYVDCFNEVTGLQIAAGEDPFQFGSSSSVVRPCEVLAVWWPERSTALAFDWNLLTDWWSVCSNCPLGAAWIGLSLPAPRNVRCLRLFQSSVAPGNYNLPWFTTSLSLEKWNGNHWVSVKSYGASRGTTAALCT